MRKMVLFLVSLSLALFQTAIAQDVLVQNLGAGHEGSDHLKLYTWNERDSMFYVGSAPNGHLNVYDPQESFMEFKGYTNPDHKENYIWTICSDTQGVVYGGTCQSAPAYIFAYDPFSFTWTQKTLSQFGITFVWSSAVTDDFAYFGTEGGVRGRLIKWDKNNPDEYNDVFDNLRYPQDSLPLSRNFVFGRCSVEFQSFLGGQYSGEMKVRSMALGPQGGIYGGTGNGFVFAYTPGVDTLCFVNVKEALFPGQPWNWGPTGIDFLTGDGNKVFGNFLGNDSIGIFEVDFSSNPPVRRIYYNGSGSLIHGSSIKIIGNNLYIHGGNYYRYNWATDSTQDLGYSGHLYFTHYVQDGLDYLAAFENISDTTGQITEGQFSAVRTDGSGIIVHTFDLPRHQSSDLHPRFRSLAADDGGNVCGGLYFLGDFVEHKVSEDTQSTSVNYLGPCGGANADAAIAYGHYIYYGYYDGLGLGVFDASICDGPPNWSPSYDSNTHNPDGSHNPLQRHLKNGYIYNGFTTVQNTIDDGSLVRVNCFSADTNRDLLYIGTGSRTPYQAGKNAWIIKYDAAHDSVLHLCEIRPWDGEGGVFNLTDSLAWVEDLDIFYDSLETFIFVLGKQRDFYETPKTLIIDVQGGYQPHAIHEENVPYNNILVDPVNNKIYVSWWSEYSIHSISGVIDSGFTNTAFISGNVGAYGFIKDIVKGNDGRIYMGYGDYIGFFDISDNLHTIDRPDALINDFPSHTVEHGVYRMAAPLDRNNYNLYVGALDGHMYVMFPNKFVSITSAASDSATEDYPFQYVASATGVDTSALCVHFENFPSWVTDTSNATLSGTPDSGGYDTFLVIASDGAVSDTHLVTVSITDILTGPIEDSITISRNVILTEDVLIDTGAVLTVSPGVSFYVYPDTDAHNIGNSPSDVELICRGRLNAIGNAGDTIRFVPYSSSPNANDWRGIRIDTSAACSLSYCRITYATIGVELKNKALAKICNADIKFNQDAITCLDDVNIEISNSTLNYNSNDGIHNYGGYLTADGCIIDNNAAYGIHGYHSKGNVVKYSAVDSNGIGGIYCYGGYLIVDSSSFKVNGIYGIYGYHSDVDVSYSNFVGNNAYGIKLDGYATSSHWAEIAYDTISATASYQNGCGIYIANLDSSRVFECQSRGFPLAGLFLNGSDTKVEKSNFSSNTSNGIYADNYSFPNIRWCIIDTLSIGVRAYNSKPDIGRVNVVPDSGKCTFQNCSKCYIDLYYRPSISSDTMYMQLNYYGVQVDPWKFYRSANSVPIKYLPVLAAAPPAPKLGAEINQPSAFELRQNYPNPFNPSTNISFSLETSAYTVVTIYNVLGQAVTTLANDYLDAGEHTIIWNGTNARGTPVSSGIYFYTIESGEHFQSKRMTLLR